MIIQQKKVNETTVFSKAMLKEGYFRNVFHIIAYSSRRGLFIIVVLGNSWKKYKYSSSIIALGSLSLGNLQYMMFPLILMFKKIYLRVFFYIKMNAKEILINCSEIGWSRKKLR